MKILAKCKNCGKDGADYIHFKGGHICDKCVGDYFTCPDCGVVFDRDDFEHADAGNGFCFKCAVNH